MRALASWLLPGGAVLFMVLVLAAASGAELVDDELLGTIAERYRLLVYGAGLALALAFHRSRVWVAIAALLLVDAVAMGPTTGPELISALGALVGRVFFATAGLLLDDTMSAELRSGPALMSALNTLLIALLGLLAIGRDRGVLSTGGLVQLAAAASLGWITVLAMHWPGSSITLARFAQQPEWILDWTGIPPIALVIASLSLLPAGYSVYRWEGAVERSVVWSQIMLLIAVHPGLPAPFPLLLLMATGLTLTLSVLETSYAMAYRDELTGLPSRRSLMRDLDSVGGTYSLAMVDVDHFKRFNDKHGHDVGDQVLKLVASRLAKAPGGAKAYRYGGEEFAILFRGRAGEEAMPHLEVTRAAVERARFSVRAWNRPKRKPDKSKVRRRKKRGQKKLSVTVSMGVADSASGNGSPDAVLKKADEALYRAKKKGRNRIAK